MQSKWFAVNQGVRQGGILSTLIYNLFIDGLLIELEESNLGTCILDNKIGNCSLADDLTLSCTSPANLQNMLDIVNVYSCRWRYIINPLKSNIIVFGDRSRNKLYPNFYLGQDKINIVNSVKHVGIYLSDNFTHNDKINNAVTKAKASFYSLMSLGLNLDYVNPILSASLVHRICVPTLLYGSELWFNLSNQNIDQLEIFYRFCAKVVQGFDKLTRTDMCLSMLGWYSIQAEIDKRKLGFLQKLCCMPNNLLSKQIFNTRLSMFVIRTDGKQKGYIPDILEY